MNPTFHLKFHRKYKLINFVGKKNLKIFFQRTLILFISDTLSRLFWFDFTFPIFQRKFIQCSNMCDYYAVDYEFFVTIFIKANNRWKISHGHDSLKIRIKFYISFLSANKVFSETQFSFSLIIRGSFWQSSWRHHNNQMSLRTGLQCACYKWSTILKYSALHKFKIYENSVMRKN